MNDFWTNISRYPRFFISSFLGLILVLLSPLKNVFRTNKFRIFFIIGCILVFTIVWIIIKSMTVV